MAAETPADQRHNATWMSTDELSRVAEALFSFQSSNERDESARIVLIRELADRGIDPHTLGYKGGPVVLNPNPKEDPAAKRVRLDKAKADGEAKKVASEAAKKKLVAEAEAKKKLREAEKKKREAEAAARQKARDELNNRAAQTIIDYAPTGLTDRKAG